MKKIKIEKLCCTDEKDDSIECSPNKENKKNECNCGGCC